MEDFANIQEETLELIKKVGINYKKQAKARITKGYLQARIETLDEYWTKFKTTHFELLKSASIEQRKKHAYFTQDIFSQAEEEYLMTKADLVDTLDGLSGTVSHSKTYNKAEATYAEEVKLPKVNLPQFAGSYHEWCSFRDLYTTLIHDKETLSKVQKLHYLKSSVTGEAEQLLKHLQITEKNYDIAWDTLNKRYNNKRMIVNTILNKLMNQKKVIQATSNSIKDLLDTTQECLNGLKNNEVDICNWDTMIIYIVLNKLDDDSHRQWEEELGTLPVQELPELKKFIKFLETRFRVLEMVPPTHQSKDKVILRQKSFLTTRASTNVQCVYCKGDHLLFSCKEFTSLNVEARTQYVTKERLCFNCLSPTHSVKFCKNKVSCHRCRRRHHSLLHYENAPIQGSVTSAQPSNTASSGEACNKEIQKPGPSEVPVIRNYLVTQGHTALMATALVNIHTGKGLQLVRALLDPCSQESFISEAVAQRLQLRMKPADGIVTGVGQMSTNIKYATDIQIYSRFDNNYMRECTAFVVKHVTDVMPTAKVNREKWSHLQHLSLADPTYHTPGNIDMLLGVNIYTDALMGGVIKGEPGSPIAQQTRLGWILSGGLLKSEKREIKTLHLNVTLESLVERFWETERLESEVNDTLTPQELRAEQIYEKTITRNPEGRYIVTLPFKSEKPTLPENSREIALKRFMSTEKRLTANTELRESYNEVMREYLTLQHMELVDHSESLRERVVYLPHHAVIREDKDTTRVRVVYDASCKGTNGVSLNDELLIGPSLQEELRDILMRWRTYKVCFVADIIKMYRQIMVRKEDTDYQRIFWRFNPEEEIQEYRLLTVTFGTACAPYLAMRTLRQIAIDEANTEEYDLARDMINKSFYMDDVLFGGDTEEVAKEAKKQITEVLRRGGFELQKWLSNSKDFMSTVKMESRATSTEIDLNIKETIKALGITWNSNEDALFVTKKVDTLLDREVTKRSVLTVVASLFDPMGWLAPSVVKAKIFMQKLWEKGLDWDEKLPEDLRSEWMSYGNNIKYLSDIKLERWIGTTSNNEIVELHGFADASKAAYAAVVYCRVVQADQPVRVSLIMAKTKIAPLKEISLPRLELCATVLLSKLLSHVAKAMNIESKNTYAYTDSKVTLAWILGDPSKWTPFVKNRVIEINNTLNTTWAYVNTKHNPADPASRGVAPEKLKDNMLWFHGPEFLHQRELSIHVEDVEDTDLEKKKNIIMSCNTTVNDKEEEFILTLTKRCSSLRKLVAVVAYCLRWLHLKRKEIIKDNLPTNVTHEEREEALTVCIKLSQSLEYPEEIHALKDNKPLKKSSRLLALNPFLDEKGVLRVGGRLKHADLEFLSKHPIIVSKDNALIQLLLAEAHKKTLHGGPQLMTTYLRGRYWLLKAGKITKTFVKNCILCTRQKAMMRTQLMGDLPEVRVKPSRPFLISGVDFAGPVSVRMSPGRGSKSMKAYISIFICMVTKAIHIECVSNMTTEAFMAAFRRFVSRRGFVKEMWSDHGTNFVGASKELLDTWKLGKNSIPNELRFLLDSEGTKWKFVPPQSPNFAGLWEAGVRSIKFHLKRILGEATPTFEELNTLLAQIEACLNSRPLSPLSDHPDDLEPLTPAHFLVGEPLITLPEKDLTLHKENSLTRWQNMQRMLQLFWRKWQSEYLTRLQERPKWKTRTPEFEIGELVLLKDDRFPPSKWLLGRILKKYPGQDNITRTYDVRTVAGVYTRSISKLCPLPDVRKDNAVLSGGIC